MYMAKISLVFFTLVVICCIFIILDCNTVMCAPLRGDRGAKSAVEVNQQVGHAAFLTNKAISPETIPGLLSSDDFIIEGDIIVEGNKNAVDVKWAAVDGRVSIPYVIAPELVSRTDHIQTAMDMIANKSCVTFHKRENEDHYLSFKPHHGCASYVGFIGGEQPVYVGKYCSVGNLCHELLHALGFHHEHSRKDRDQHIQIKLENVIKGKERNFRKVEGNTLGVPYDLGSILHYGSLFFSSNGQSTIVPLNSDVEIGQRIDLSEFDVQRLRALYSCGNSNN